jgi:hypothetical protein
MNGILMTAVYDSQSTTKLLVAKPEIVLFNIASIYAYEEWCLLGY